jgi:hypothetical protein
MTAAGRMLSQGLHSPIPPPATAAYVWLIEQQAHPLRWRLPHPRRHRLTDPEQRAVTHQRSDSRPNAGQLLAAIQRNPVRSTIVSGCSRPSRITPIRLVPPPRNFAPGTGRASTAASTSSGLTVPERPHRASAPGGVLDGEDAVVGAAAAQGLAHPLSDLGLARLTCGPAVARVGGI